MPLYTAEQTSNFNNFDKSVNDFLWFLDNEYIQASLALFLILYAGVIAPKLSPGIMESFDNIFVKLFAFIAIVLVSKKSPTIALIAGIAVLITLMIANNQIVIRTVAQEKFAQMGPDDMDNGYTMNDVAYYPKETHYPVKMDDLAINSMKQNNVKVYGINETGYDDMSGSFLEGQSEMDSSVSIYANPTHQGRMFEENVINNKIRQEVEEAQDKYMQANYGVQVEEKQAGQSGHSMEEVIRVPVEKLAEKVEESTGEVVPEEMKEEIVEEVKQILSQKASEGQPITKEYIVAVCKNAYMDRMQGSAEAQ